MEPESLKMNEENVSPPSPFGEYCLNALPGLPESFLEPLDMNNVCDMKEINVPLSGCNCLKTKCLKLYCECFANRLKCNPNCKCRNCQNTENNEIRMQAISEAFQRNPIAFQHSRFTGTRGCSCKRSGCRKKYCECFLNGISCSAACMCEKCKNIKDN